jgi:hypothetical protein
MALTGHLSDLSLSELIEFFCNQRKSGRLKVLYPRGAGYFYLLAGSVVDARIGLLQGIDAVYFALTLPNAEFEFSAEAESVGRTINQPWTQVVLEGLRRLDEGIVPGVAFPPGYVPQPDELEFGNAKQDSQEVHKSFGPSFLAFVNKESMGKRKPLFLGAVAVAVIGSVAAIGVPAGWYHRSKVAAVSETKASAPPVAQDSPAPSVAAPKAENLQPNAQPDEGAANAAKRLREKERAKAREVRAATGNPSALTPLAPPANAASDAAKPGPKKVVVTVTYDESGRVTQASGGDATALRIARQKRFPAGKAGSATVTIPIN